MRRFGHKRRNWGFETNYNSPLTRQLICHSLNCDKSPASWVFTIKMFLANYSKYSLFYWTRYERDSEDLKRWCCNIYLTFQPPSKTCTLFSISNKGLKTNQIQLQPVPFSCHHLCTNFIKAAIFIAVNWQPYTSQFQFLASKSLMFYEH